MDTQTIVNRVAQSPIVTIDLEDFYPDENTIVELDIKQFLFKELLLKETDFRAQVQSLNKQDYEYKYVGVFCSNDAIVPMWAYMLLVSALKGEKNEIFFANKASVIEQLHIRNIMRFDSEIVRDKPVVIKGCGQKPISTEAYIKITEKVLPVAKMVMYGEPCSTVPIYKRKKTI